MSRWIFSDGVVPGLTSKNGGIAPPPTDIAPTPETSIVLQPMTPPANNYVYREASRIEANSLFEIHSPNPGTWESFGLGLLSIAVTPADDTINVSDTLQYTATGTYDDGSTQDITASVTWASSDGTIASISGSGLATANQSGTVTITATLGIVSGTTPLHVHAS